MGKVSRRRAVMASVSTIALSSAALGAVGSFISSPTFDASSSSSSDMVPASTHSLSTAFSCGSHWRKAQTCSTLCPTGQDSACPDGESCYAGIPCTEESSSSEDNMKYILKQQAQMEQREINRLRKQREEEHVDRFVCGESYVEAAESCSGNNAAGSSSSSFAAEGSGMLATAQYCPTGSSSQCPASGMQCYAAVSCPRDYSHHEEAPLSVEEVSSVQLSDSLLTTSEQQPTLLLPNSTTATDGTHALLIIEEGYSSIVSRTVSALLSTRYGLN